MKIQHRLLTILIILCIITALFPPKYIEASSSIKIHNYTTDKTTNYTGKQLSYIINGAVVPLKETPGIIENGYALASYKEIFEDYYKVSASFNISTNKLTLKHNGITIIMTLGSTKASVNGVSKKLGVAPVKVKYVSNGEERILVPTRFVAETFGMNYLYDSIASSVTINYKASLSYDSSSYKYVSAYGLIIYNGNLSTNNKVPVISLDGTVMASYGLLKDDMGIDYSYDSTTGNISLAKGDILLNMSVGNTTAYVNNIEVDSKTAPILAKYNDYDKEIILLPIYFITRVFGYDYSWDSKSKTCYIDTNQTTGIWKESVLNSIASKSDTMDYLSLSSLENMFNTNPIQTYYSLSDNGISDEYLNIVKKINSRSITVPKSTNTVSKLLNVTKNDNTLQNSEAYSFSFSEPIYNVENLGFDENDQLVLSISNSICNENTYMLNGDMVSYAMSDMSQLKECTELKILLKSTHLAYDIKLSEDNRQLILTVYKNQLTDVLFGINEEGIEFIQFKALFPIHAEIVNKNNVVVLRMEEMVNPYGSRNELFDNSQTLRQINIVKDAMNTLIISLKKLEGKEVIYTEASENILTLYLSDESDESVGINQVISWDIVNNIDITLPAEVNYNDLITEDRYMKRQIIINMPGNHKEFYDLNPIVNSYEVVTNIEVVENNNTTDIILTTSVVRGFDITGDNGNLKLRIGNPKEFYDKIIVLDAGHGGYDPGAVKNYINEKDFNFTILNKYTAEYFNNSDIKVYFTRTEDVLVNLYERAAFATEVSADLFISLHMNANNSSSVNGTGVYYSKLNTSSSKEGVTSKKLAQKFADNISKAIGTKNNGILAENFVVVRDTQVPAVLIELAFMTNSSDFKKLNTKSVQKKAAEAIYKTIVSLYE